MQDFRQLSLIKIHPFLLTLYNEIQVGERYKFLYFTVIVAIYSRKNKLTDSNCRAPYIPPRYSFVAYFIKSLDPSGRMALNCFELTAPDIIQGPDKRNPYPAPDERCVIFQFICRSFRMYSEVLWKHHRSRS